MAICMEALEVDLSVGTAYNQWTQIPERVARRSKTGAWRGEVRHDPTT